MTICLPWYLKCMGAQYFWVSTNKNSGFLKLSVLKMCKYSKLLVLRIEGPQKSLRTKKLNFVGDQI